MRNKIDSVKTYVAEHKVPIAFFSGITIVYGGIAANAYYGYKAIGLQYEIALLENPPQS